MTLKTCKTAVRASTLLAAIALSGGAFAAGAAGDSYSFETNDAIGSGDLAGLNGNGEVTTTSYEYSGAIGKPLAGDHYKVLSIAGTVVYTNDTSSTAPNTNASQVDFMFKAEPTDELEDPTDTDIHVALAVGETNAVGNTAPIKLWCTPNNADGAGWVNLVNVTTGSWVRATIVLDYNYKRCRVSIDGDPAVVAGSVVSNSWYSFANTGVASTYVKSITMVGSTMVDDLVVTNSALAEYKAAGTESASVNPTSGNTDVAVSYEYMNKYGVTKAQVQSDATVGAGMKVSEKFVAGLDPNSDTKLELKTMTPSSPTSVTVTFPGNNASGYEVFVSTDRAGNTPAGAEYKTTTSTFTADTTAAGEKIKQATVALPEDGAAYIHVKATNE